MHGPMCIGTKPEVLQEGSISIANRECFKPCLHALDADESFLHKLIYSPIRMSELQKAEDDTSCIAVLFLDCTFFISVY